jgi:hypothetical protein
VGGQVDEDEGCPAGPGEGRDPELGGDRLQLAAELGIARTEGIGVRDSGPGRGDAKDQEAGEEGGREG